MLKEKRNFPKNCKWPLEISPKTGLPDGYVTMWEQRVLEETRKEEERKRISEEKKKERRKLPWRAKLWSILAMQLKDEVEAAKVAYDLDDTPEARKFAIAISSRNKKDKRIHEFVQDIAESSCTTVLELSKTAEKEAVRLAAAIDILNRLGLKAPDRIEIDDKRELTDNDRLAISSVIDILHPKVTDAEIIEGEKREITPDMISGITDQARG